MLRIDPSELILGPEHEFRRELLPEKRGIGAQRITSQKLETLNCLADCRHSYSRAYRERFSSATDLGSCESRARAT